MLHTRHAATMHIVIGVVLVLVAQGGRTLTIDSERNKNGLPVGRMDYGAFEGLFTDGQCSAKVWRTRQQSKKLSSRWTDVATRRWLSDQTTKQPCQHFVTPSSGRWRNVFVSEESLKLHQNTILRRLAWFENAIKLKVRTLVIATRELDGVVRDPEHVALAWWVRFACQIISCTVKGADGLTAFQRAFQRTSHPRRMPSAWREKILYFKSQQEEDVGHRQIVRRHFLGRQRRFWWVHCGNACWLSGVQNCHATVSWRRSRFGLFQQHSWDTQRALCQMKNHVNPESHESNRWELTYVLCMQIFLQSAQSHPSRVVFTSDIQLSWTDTGTPLDVLAVKQQWPRGLRWPHGTV